MKDGTGSDSRGRRRRRRNWAVRGCAVAALVAVGVVAAGCSVSLPWGKTTTTHDSGTTVLSSTTTLEEEEPSSTTGSTESSTTRTTRPGASRFDTPEAAVKAVAPVGWVLKVASRESTRAEIWAGPPQSEFVTAYIVRKGVGGWIVVDEVPLGGGEPGDGETSLVGGPWYEEDFPEIFRPGSGLGVPFRSDAYPSPAHSGYPQNNVGAKAVWLSLGEMLNLLKEGYITDATAYVTADFYGNFYFDFFNPGEPVEFREFELTGWQEAGGGEFQIWANLYSADATSSYLTKAVFTGVALADGTGLFVWADLWQPVEY